MYPMGITDRRRLFDQVLIESTFVGVMHLRQQSLARVVFRAGHHVANARVLAGTQRIAQLVAHALDSNAQPLAVRVDAQPLAALMSPYMS